MVFTYSKKSSRIRYRGFKQLRKTTNLYYKDYYPSAGPRSAGQGKWVTIMRNIYDNRPEPSASAFYVWSSFLKDPDRNDEDRVDLLIRRLEVLQGSKKAGYNNVVDEINELKSHIYIILPETSENENLWRAKIQD